jgi:hypothetical protein
MGGKGRPARKADNLTPICEPTVYNIWELRRPTALWAFTACYRDSFTFLLVYFECTACIRLTKTKIEDMTAWTSACQSSNTVPKILDWLDIGIADFNPTESSDFY